MSLAGALRGRTPRVLLRVLVLLGVGVLAVSWYAHATRDYVEVRVRAENVAWRVLINCVPVGSQSAVEETFDLGWLRPQDVVSVEFRSKRRLDGTLRKGNFKAERSIDRGKWVKLKVLGTGGRSVELPPNYKRAFMAGGTDLGENEGCGSPPQWAFARDRLGQMQRPATRRDAPAFDVATVVRPWLLWGIAVIAVVMFALAYFGRDRLPVPLRRVVDGTLAVSLALATVHIALAAAASLAIVAAAWQEHRQHRRSAAVDSDTRDG